VTFAPRGGFVLTYESTAAARGEALTGTIVVRRGSDGGVEAMYDVADVTDLAIAPDGRTFAYSTRFAGAYTVMALVPL
jgi:hypothetical protein